MENSSGTDTESANRTGTGRHSARAGVAQGLERRLGRRPDHAAIRPSVPAAVGISRFRGDTIQLPSFAQSPRMRHAVSPPHRERRPAVSLPHRERRPAVALADCERRPGR